MTKITKYPDHVQNIISAISIPGLLRWGIAMGPWIYAHETNKKVCERIPSTIPQRRRSDIMRRWKCSNQKIKSSRIFEFLLLAWLSFPDFAFSLCGIPATARRYRNLYKEYLQVPKNQVQASATKVGQKHSWQISEVSLLEDSVDITWGAAVSPMVGRVLRLCEPSRWRCWLWPIDDGFGWSQKKLGVLWLLKSFWRFVFGIICSYWNILKRCCGDRRWGYVL